MPLIVNEGDEQRPVVVYGPVYVRGERVTRLRRWDGSEFTVVVPFMGMEDDGRRSLLGWVRDDRTSKTYRFNRDLDQQERPVSN